MKSKIIVVTLLVPTLALALFIDRVEQTTWVGGDSVRGPVFAWGDRFWASDSVTYNVDGQVSPIAIGANYTAWTRHLIDSSSSIKQHSIVAADFDNDSIIELVGIMDTAIAVYENNGAGNFTKVKTYKLNKVSDWGFICKGDLDNDGDIDVVVPEKGGTSGALGWFENTGNLNFTYRPIEANMKFTFVEVGDIDGDNDLDLGAVKYNIGSPGIRIYKNDGFGTFSYFEQYPDTAWRLRFEDMDDDNKQDMVIASGINYVGWVKVFINDGTGHFNAVWAEDCTPNTPDGLWTRDFDNDGDKDILLGRAVTECNVHWYENDSSGVNYTKHTIFVGMTDKYGDGCSAADMDMDGCTDVLSAWSSVGFFRQISSDDFTRYDLEGPGGYIHWIIPENLDWELCMDQDVDILVCRTGKFLWFENQMLNNYASKAWLESSVLEIDCDSTLLWRYFGWETCTPSANTLALRVRAANDTISLFAIPWSSCTPIYPKVDYDEDSVLLSTLITGNEELLQYRIDFGAPPSQLPVVYKIWVDYDCSGAGVEEVKTKYDPFIKVYGKNIRFFVPDKGNVSLVLYDISGRGIPLLGAGIMEKGWHSLELPVLPAGPYFVRMKSDAGTYTAKFVNQK